MREALICVNFVCNLRCKVCAVWQQHNPASVPPGLYRRLPRGLRRVTLTGGEIFLDPALEERVRVIAETCPRARVILITNGTLPDKVEDLVRRVRGDVPRVGVRVPLDGPRELHDRLRGHEGAFDGAVETLRRLRALGLRDLGVSFTVQPENLGAAPAVAALADDLGVEFVCNVVQNSSLAYATRGNQIGVGRAAPELKWVIARQLRSPRWKDWFRAYFSELLLRYHRTGDRPLPCTAGRASFFLNYDGGVYACNMLDDRLGDIADDDVEAIFAKPEVRQRVDALETCQACWTSCNVGEALRRNPLRMLAWVVRRKIRGSRTPA